MNYLEGKGYVIEIIKWSGNLGNHIIQLANAVNIAVNTQSLLMLPDHSVFNKKLLDFRNHEDAISNLRISGFFFLQEDCFQYPLNTDRVRREILQKYIKPLIFTEDQIKILDTADKSYDLVINIRSGDVFRPDWKSKAAVISGLSNYVQPPLSFYEKILDEGKYKNVLLVTQPDMVNPVIRKLMDRENVKLKQHISPVDDMISLMRSEELVTCHSTFSWNAALMSACLRKLHQPSFFRIKGVDDFKIITYYFPDYIERGKWNASLHNMKMMLKYKQKFIKTETEDSSVNKNEISECGAIRYEFKYKPPVFQELIRKLPGIVLKIRIFFRPRTRLRTIGNHMMSVLQKMNSN